MPPAELSAAIQSLSNGALLPCHSESEVLLSLVGHWLRMPEDQSLSAARVVSGRTHLHSRRPCPQFVRRFNEVQYVIPSNGSTVRERHVACDIAVDVDVLLTLNRRGIRIHDLRIRTERILREIRQAISIVVSSSS